MRRNTFTAAAFAAAGLLAGCGGDDTADVASTAGTSTSTSTGGQGIAAPFAELTIEIGTADAPAQTTATLQCGEGVTGTGLLETQDAAAAACHAISSSQDVKDLLLGRTPEPQACTEIYGGPDVARIFGFVDGEPVDATIDRTNGCGIARWDLLVALVGMPRTAA